MIPYLIPWINIIIDTYLVHSFYAFLQYIYVLGRTLAVLIFLLKICIFIEDSEACHTNLDNTRV